MAVQVCAGVVEQGMCAARHRRYTALSLRRSPEYALSGVAEIRGGGLVPVMYEYLK